MSMNTADIPWAPPMSPSVEISLACGRGGGGHAAECAALGAVAVHDIRADSSDDVSHPAKPRQIAGSDLPLHGNLVHAQRQLVGNRVELGAGWRIRLGLSHDKAHLVASLSLAIGKVEHMPEQAADRGAQHMQDFEG